MTKLFTLGCSLTYNMGWKELLCEEYDLELVNSAMFASSNSMQVRRIHSYIINNEIDKDDIIIWQITSQIRHSFSAACDPEWNKHIENVVKEDENAQYYVDSPRNYFSGSVHRDVLSNHPLIKPASHYFDYNSSMEELVSTILLLNNTYKILVIIGWDGALTQASFNIGKFNRLMQDHKVPHLSESYLHWAMRNGHSLADDLHPTMETSEIYAGQVLAPILRRLQWLK